MSFHTVNRAELTHQFSSDDIWIVFNLQYYKNGLMHILVYASFCTRTSMCAA